MRYRRFEALLTYILCEVSFQLPEMFRKTSEISKEKSPRPSKFIANSSPTGNKAGVRRVSVTQNNTGGIVPMRKILQGVLRGDSIQCMLYS
jgi:hypothetical protein